MDLRNPELWVQCRVRDKSLQSMGDRLSASVDLQRETVKSLTRKIHPLPQEVARKFVSTESLSRRQLTLPPTPPIFNHKLASNVDLGFKFIPTVWSRNLQEGPAISFVGLSAQ